MTESIDSDRNASNPSKGGGDFGGIVRFENTLQLGHVNGSIEMI